MKAAPPSSDARDTTEPLRVRRAPRLAPRRLQRKTLLVPSLITVAAFFSGFLAIVSAFRGDFEYATKCILVSIILDGLDGRVARRLNAATAFGREFDSISDVVAFGVAPAALIYCWAFLGGADEFGILVTFIYLACAGARLARFNIVEPGEAKKHFQGLPTPGAAAAMAAMVYFSPTTLSSNVGIGFAAAMVLILAATMVSNIPFLSIKHVRLTPKNAKLNLFILSLFVALAWYHSRLFFLTGSMLYVASGPFLAIQERLNEKKLDRPMAA